MTLASMASDAFTTVPFFRHPAARPRLSEAPLCESGWEYLPTPVGIARRRQRGIAAMTGLCTT